MTPPPAITNSLSRSTDDPLARDVETLLLIRHFELLLLDLFREGKLNGTTHTSLGQECIPTAVMPLVRDDDFVFSNHRGHGHYLARFGDVEGLLAEIMGKKGAVCHGVGGSQHIRRSRYFSTGVQGESLPVAVGAALQLKRERKGGIAMPFIGDGTFGQGAVYEAFNMAALWSVPMVVIVENNFMAQTTPASANMAGSIEARAAAFGIDYHCVTEPDVAGMRRRVEPILEAVRQSPHPVILEFPTRRLGPHSKGDDTRSKAELSSLHEQDWLPRYRADHPKLVASLETKVKTRLATLAADIQTREPSRWEETAA